MTADATQIAVSQAEFARLCGYARSYVTALKQAGRLVLDESGKVIVAASQARILETADPNRDDVRQRHAGQRSQTVDAPEGAKTGEDDEEEPVSPGSHDYQKARAKKEHYLAEQARLDFEQKTGRLVEKSEVESAVADLVTVFRQSLENLPHRSAPELVGKDLDAIRALLKQDIHGALTELEREFSKRLNQIGEME